MKNQYFNFILLLLFLVDTGYSFNQYYHVPIDGDLAWITVPATGYQQVRKDPLGLSVLLKNKSYQSPNRFFAHLTVSEYFKNVPNYLHMITNPINSVYLACAIAKTAIQILIICLLAAFVCTTARVLKKDFLLVALIITPLIQSSGYCRTIEVIDVATTYTFFYALPLGLLLCFFFPFYKAYANDVKITLHIGQKIFLLLLLVVLSLNGPLVPGVVLLICPAVLIYKWFLNFKKSSHLPFFKRATSSVMKIPGVYLFFFIIFIVFCLYSLYIGQNDSENGNPIPLIERYKRLPIGLFHLLTSEFGFPLLFSAIALNLALIYKGQRTKEGQQILTILKWIVVFGAVYLLLLPLGGYRSYRPNIVRSDTFMPITFGLMFIYALSTYYLITQLKSTYKVAYVSVIVLVSLVFTIADKPSRGNDCEKIALQEISKSTEKIIPLDCNCTIMSWGKISNYDDSKWNTQLLDHWGIIKGQKYYYQK